MRRRAPCAHLVLEDAEPVVGDADDAGVLRVCFVHVSTLFGGGVAGGVEEMRGVAVVVGCPLVEVVGNVEGGGVWGCVLEVNDDDLGSTSQLWISFDN